MGVAACVHIVERMSLYNLDRDNLLIGRVITLRLGRLGLNSRLGALLVLVSRVGGLSESGWGEVLGEQGEHESSHSVFAEHRSSQHSKLCARPREKPARPPLCVLNPFVRECPLPRRPPTADLLFQVSRTAPETLLGHPSWLPHAPHTVRMARRTAAWVPSECVSRPSMRCLDRWS